MDRAWRVVWIGMLSVLIARARAGQAEPIALPNPGDWRDAGLVLDTGALGSAWDVLKEGGTPCAILKHNGTFFLYYVGSDDYIAQKNNIGPAHRSIGVATSPDGIRWTKYAHNPVLTWSVSGNPEEGAPSGGVYLDSDGTFVAYYAANTSPHPTSTSVNADVRLATSADGLTFTDQAKVLDRTDTGVWGYGDELHSHVAFKSGSTWYCYYRPNGAAQGNQRLAVAWGPARDNLNQSGPVLENGTLAQLNLNTGSIVMLDGTTAAFFTKEPGAAGNISVRTTTLDALDRLSAPVKSYALGKGFGVVTLLDTGRKTWFMYYNAWTYTGLFLAPLGVPDTTGPSAPGSIQVQFASHASLTLTWNAASDADTGVLEYNVYRDGVRMGTTRNLYFEDHGLSERTGYAYAVKAVNLHGTEGSAGNLSLTTPADVLAPAIREIRAGGNARQIEVVFDEAVEASSAQTASNYALDQGLQVVNAVLQADPTKVVLTTSADLADKNLYQLGVSGVSDRAAQPNAGSPSATFSYVAAAGLIGYYRLDSGGAQDSSGSGNHGKLQGTPATQAGKVGSSARFNGNAFIEIEPSPSLDAAHYGGSLTCAAWVKVASIPPDSDATNLQYAIFSAPGLLLSYHKNQQFRARLTTSSGSYEVVSPVFAPGAWHHVAMVKNDATKKLSLYVDGQAVGTSPLSYQGQVTRGYQDVPADSNYRTYYARYRIGVQDPHFSYDSFHMDGNLDEVRIYAAPLSGAQIQELLSTNLTPVIDSAPWAHPNPVTMP